MAAGRCGVGTGLRCPRAVARQHLARQGEACPRRAPAAAGGRPPASRRWKSSTTDAPGVLSARHGASSSLLLLLLWLLPAGQGGGRWGVAEARCWEARVDARAQRCAAGTPPHRRPRRDPRHSLLLSLLELLLPPPLPSLANARHACALPAPCAAAAAAAAGAAPAAPADPGCPSAARSCSRPPGACSGSWRPRRAPSSDSMAARSAADLGGGGWGR
jgi:hypothetical protein